MWLGEKKKRRPCRLRKPSLWIRQADRYVNICKAILDGMLSSSFALKEAISAPQDKSSLTAVNH